MVFVYIEYHLVIHMIYRIKQVLRNWSDKSNLGSLVFQYARSITARVMLILPDTLYAQWFYKLYTGKRLNLNDPRTFDEKIWWLKLNNRDPYMTKCSDKYAVREVVQQAGFSDLLIKQFGVYDDAKQIPFEEFSEEVIIKCTSGSGENLFYNPGRKIDKKMIIKRMNYAIKQNPYWFSREWNYKNVPRRIIVEKVMRDSNGKLPVDYKFLCFDGEPEFLFLDIGLIDDNNIYNHNYPRNIYNMNFELMPFIETRENYKGEVKKPKNWNKMIEVARELSKPFPFCRVDLYNIDGHIYFGEITFFHGSGCNKIEPKEWDYKLGSMIDIHSPKVIRKKG